MFIGFVEALRRGGIPGHAEGASAAARGARRRRDRRRARAILLSRRATFVKDESQLDRFDQVFGKVFKGLVGDRHGEDLVTDIPEDWLEADRRELPHPRGDGGDQGARLVGRDHGSAEAAARGAGRAPPGRQQVDRHRRHLAVRRMAATTPKACASAGRGAHGRAIKVWEQARVSRPRQRRASSARATSRSRCAACAASPAKAPPTSSTSTRRSTAPRARAGSTSTCGPSGTMRSSCCCSSTSAGRWTAHVKVAEELFSAAPHRVQEPRDSSTSTTASTKACGRTIAAASSSGPDLGHAPQIWPRL